MLKLLICGQARHGKDLFASYLVSHCYMNHSSSSQYALETFLFDALNGCFIIPYKTHDEAYEDRHTCRDLWFALIAEYNKKDPMRLAKQLLEEYDIYVGMRSIVEFNQARELFDLTIWIDASERVAEREPASSITVRKEDFDIVIYNNSSVYALNEKARKLAHTLRTPTRPSK